MTIIGHEIHKYREPIVYHIRELIQIRSVMEAPLPKQPFGRGVDFALHYMLKLAQSMGFAVRNVDGYAGHAEYGEGKEMVAVLVHLDTVHEGEGWSHPPFGGDVADGKIYGRGASDNKGPAVVALFALKALCDFGLAKGRKIRVIFGTNEESGMRDMDYYFAREPLPELAFVPDAGYPITNVEMGNMNVWIKTASRDEVAGAAEEPLLRIASIKGGSPLTLVPARCDAVIQAAGYRRDIIERLLLQAGQHANITCTRDDSESVLSISAGNEPIADALTGSGNAIWNMAAYMMQAGIPTNLDSMLRFVRDRIGAAGDGASLSIACSDDVSGGLVVFMREMRATEHSAEVLCNVRYPVTSDGELIASRIASAAYDYGLETEVVRHLKPVYVHPDHPVIRKLSEAYEAITGERATLQKMGAGTYARKLNNNGVAFGAVLRGGENTRMHQPDEFVDIEALMRHGEICLQAMHELTRP